MCLIGYMLLEYIRNLCFECESKEFLSGHIMMKSLMQQVFQQCVHDTPCIPLNTKYLIVIAQSLSFDSVRMLSLMYVQWQRQRVYSEERGSLEARG